jgi:hypothetical protein
MGRFRAIDQRIYLKESDNEDKVGQEDEGWKLGMREVRRLTAI